jgi:signal transduction histidine kinase/DNA-binding response OmpR family regulator
MTSDVLSSVDKRTARPGDTPIDRRIRVNTFIVAAAVSVALPPFMLALLLTEMVKMTAVLIAALVINSMIVMAILSYLNVNPRVVAHVYLCIDMLCYGSGHWLSGGWEPSFHCVFSVFSVPVFASFIFDRAGTSAKYFMLASAIYLATFSFGVIYEPQFLIDYRATLSWDRTTTLVFTMLMYWTTAQTYFNFMIVDKLAKDSLQEETLGAISAASEAEAVAAVATRANEAKTRFLSIMSHEIRNPLTSVVLNVDMLVGTKLTTAQRNYAEGIGRGASVVLHIINDVLDTTKIEAGKVTLEQVDIDLRSTAEFVVQSVAVSAHAKGLDLSLECDDNVPPFVVGDATRLRQVMHNLLGNAVKFTREGHVALRLALDEGGGDAGQPGHELHFVASVADSGVGIDEEGKTRLFQEFSQVDDSTTRQYGGTGLGLFIVKQLLGLMGGSVDVESTPGVGTTFSFDFYCGMASAKAERGAKHRRTKAQVIRRLTKPPVAGQRLRLVGLFRTKPAADAFACYGRMVVGEHGDVVTALRSSDAVDAVREATAAGGAVVVFVDGALTSPALFAASHTPVSVAAGSAKPRSAVGVVVAPDGTDVGEWHMTVGAPLYPAPLSKVLFCAIDVLIGARPLFRADHSSSEADVGTKSLRRVRKEVRGDGKAPLVLVVDDFSSMRDVTCAALTTLGFRTLAAVNGQDGVDKLVAADAADDPVDVIIMDIEMPVMDGHAATRAIRDLGADAVESRTSDPDEEAQHARIRLLSRTPVVAMTANSMRDDRTRCFEAGMDEFVGKPVSRAKLSEVVTAMLAKRGRDVANAGRLATVADLDDAAGEGSGGSGIGRQLRVLLADDAVDVRTVVSLALGSLGATVEQVGDGLAAVEAFTSAPPGHFRLILLDLNMPGINGIEAAQQIRALEEQRTTGKRALVVAVTGEDDGAVGEECARAGFDRVLSKPVTRAALEQIVDSLGRRGGGKARVRSPRTRDGDRNSSGLASARSSRKSKKRTKEPATVAPEDPGEPERRVQARATLREKELEPPKP